MNEEVVWLLRQFDRLMEWCDDIHPGSNEWSRECRERLDRYMAQEGIE